MNFAVMDDCVAQWATSQMHLNHRCKVIISSFTVCHTAILCQKPPHTKAGTMSWSASQHQSCLATPHTKPMIILLHLMKFLNLSAFGFTPLLLSHSVHFDHCKSLHSFWRTSSAVASCDKQLGAIHEQSGSIPSGFSHVKW